MKEEQILAPFRAADRKFAVLPSTAKRTVRGLQDDQAAKKMWS